MVFTSPSVRKYEENLRESVRFLKKNLGKAPSLGVVFGSGLGEEFLQEKKPTLSLSFQKVPHFGKTLVEGHSGKVCLFSKGRGIKHSLVVLQGRRHYYEGLEPHELVHPYRSLALWGVKRLLLTNAAGALNKNFKPGELVMIEDHINLMGMNPLRGLNLDFLGPRFPSLAKLYKNSFSRGIQQITKSLKIPMKSGVYVGLAGPSYETPAEVKAYQKLGGDLVGMSTVPEAIAASHAGMEVAALSAVANSALQLTSGLAHEEVLSVAKMADRKLNKILLRLVQRGLTR